MKMMYSRESDVLVIILNIPQRKTEKILQKLPFLQKLPGNFRADSAKEKRGCKCSPSLGTVYCFAYSSR